MKAVILAGGLGTRISEESVLRPKPMIEIGGKPILWHVMKTLSNHGINDFVICLGYKGYAIKEYFSHYFLHACDVTFDFRDNSRTLYNTTSESWRVTLLETGENTMTGGRLKRVRQHLGDEDFCFTYGDAVADIDIGKLVDFHRRSGTKATVTAVQPPGRFGKLAIDDGRVTSFEEKPVGDGGWINGGFFILSPSVIDYIADDSTTWEAEPLARLAQERQLSAYKHNGFWQCMDTLRDKMYLESLWEAGAPWKTW